MATWIEVTFGERVEEYEEIVGYHLEQACRQRLTSDTASDRGLSERASRILASAGRRALGRGDLNAAIHLLPRAWDLNPIDNAEFLEVRLLFGEAVRRRGDFTHADEVLVDLERRAKAIGNRSLEWRATMERLLIRSSTTNLTFEEAKPIVDRAIEIFGDLGDDEGLAKSWDFLAWMHFNSGRCADALEAYGKAAHHAEAAGDTALFMDESSAEATQASYGPTPVAEGLAICNETLERVKGHPAIEAWVYEGRSRLEAMQGNVEAARAAITRARSLAHELGATHSVASMSKSAGDVEWYAGDISAEERERRSGYEAFVRSGANAFRATWAAWLALSLVRLERDADEALDLTRESESLAGEDDVTAQVPWREARAMILARRGETDEALKLAQEAVDIAERTDWLNIQGDAQMTLAEVLQLAGQSEGAVDAARAAVERYERKGDVVATGWARALEADLAPSAI